MDLRIGNAVWLRRDTQLADLRCRMGTNIGRVGDAWAEGGEEHISLVYEEEQVLAVGVPPAEFVLGRATAASMASAVRSAASLGTVPSSL